MIYLLYEKLLYSTIEFTVLNIINNIFEITRIEKMSRINENNELVIGEAHRTFRINMKGIEVKDVNSKKINLSD